MDGGVCRIHARLVRAVVDQKRIVVVKAAAQLWILPDSAELFQHDGLVSILPVHQACLATLVLAPHEGGCFAEICTKHEL